MNELLEWAMSAHGGIERRLSIKQLAADVSISGGLKSAKGKAGILDRISVEVDSAFAISRTVQHLYP